MWVAFSKGLNDLKKKKKILKEAFTLKVKRVMIIFGKVRRNNQKKFWGTYERLIILHFLTWMAVTYCFHVDQYDI